MMDVANKTIEALREELSQIQITDDLMREEAMEAMSAEELEEMDDLHYDAQNATPYVIKRLRALVHKYPGVNALKNFLTVAYSTGGKALEMKALILQMYVDHPEYLFARLNYAALFMEDGPRLDQIPDILGTTLSLRDSEPGRELFHFSEVKGFYQLVGIYYIRKGRLDLAQEILEYLGKYSDDPSELSLLTSEVTIANFESISEMALEEDRRAIRVMTVLPVSEMSSPPAFNHPEVEALMRGGSELTEEYLRNILSLERASLVADLETLLEMAIHESPELPTDTEGEDGDFEWGVARPEYALQALRLLGALSASEALPSVLRFLGKPVGILEFWFGDGLEAEVWEPLYFLVDSRLEDCLDWILSPGLSGEGRALVGTAVAQIALHHPERRAEVEEWFRRVFASLLDVPVSANVLDSWLVTALVWEVTSMRARTLLPLIQALYAKGYVFESHVGDFRSIETDIADPVAPHDVRSLRGFPFVPKASEAYSPPLPVWEAPVIEADPSDDELPERVVTNVSPKVGRNEPCPCGSGKKYKKCCGKIV